MRNETRHRSRQHNGRIALDGPSRPRLRRDFGIGVDEEIADLEGYLVRLQDEATDVKVRLSDLRAKRSWHLRHTYD